MADRIKRNSLPAALGGAFAIAAIQVLEHYQVVSAVCGGI